MFLKKKKKAPILIFGNYKTFSQIETFVFTSGKDWTAEAARGPVAGTLQPSGVILDLAVVSVRPVRAASGTWLTTWDAEAGSFWNRGC